MIDLDAIERRRREHAGYGPDTSYQLLYVDIPGLITEVRRLRGVLVKNEWIHDYVVHGDWCPECGNERKEGHTSGCSIGAALAGKEDSDE